jgi:hypothetical protein
MWHTTCTRINRGDSWLLMVGSQIDNLIRSLSFGHNLCFKHPNGSCEPISDIYVLRTFQWYKELFILMSFDSCNRLLKIQKSIETLTPKVGVHLEVKGVHSLTLSYTPGSMKCDSQASLLARTFASPCFYRKPKTKVATIIFN